MIAGKSLPRRTFLRGMGTAIALPLLDAMVPSLGAVHRLQPKAPCRMAFVYVPNGIIMRDWTPAKEGAAYAPSPILEPLAPHRDRTLILSGLTQNNGRAMGDGPGDHARASASFLTGVHPKKTDGADIQCGLSVDQVAAQKIGNKTRFASLELGCRDGRLAGDCDSGYSCAYTNSISWRADSSPLPPEVNPRAVFERLFGTDESEDPATRARRRKYRNSILDFVLGDARKLQGDLGPTDRRKLDEYLFAVREIEKRIETVESETGELAAGMGKPDGIPVGFREHVRLMFDLMALAFQSDLTRISTFMVAREGSNRTYREIGVSDAHHQLTHHQGDEKKIELISRINRFHIEQFGYFLQKLRSIEEGEGTLLDQMMIVYGSGLSDGNDHEHHDLPVVVAGGGAGSLKTGRHVRYSQETPMNNLYVSMLERMDIPIESLGDSNGELADLSDI